MAGSEDMDLTQIGPHVVSDEFNFEEDNFDFNTDDDSHMMDEDGDTMDVTRALDANIIRRRTLSMGGVNAQANRPPLAQLAHSVAVNNNNELSVGSVDMSQDMSQDMSRDDSKVSSGDDTQSVPMEFTVPITQGLRQPAHQDPAWLALRAVTHSGDVPFEPPPMSEDEDATPLASHVSGDDMNLDDAMQRLMRARDSLPMAQSIPPGTQNNEDSFTSSEGSFMVADGFRGDETINLSKIVGRGSLPGFSTRPSLAYDSTMEVTSAYGHIHAINGLPVESTPTHGRIAPQPAPVQEMARLPVFQPPSVPAPLPVVPQSGQPESNLAAPPPVFAPPHKAPASPPKFNPTPKPTSPVKPKPSFTAAFAPPTGRPSPKKSRPPTHATSGSSASVRGPAKRGLNETLDEDHEEGPSTRRVALDSNDKPKPAPLPTSTKPHLGSAIRRPSGYFARRQSLGAALQGGTNDATSRTEQTAHGPRPPSPKKDTGKGKARASLGSAAAADAWKRFDRNAVSEAPARPRDEHPPERDSNSANESNAVTTAPTNAAPPASPVREPPLAIPGAPSDLERLSTADGFGEDDYEESMELDEEVRQPDDQARLQTTTAATELWAEGVQGDGHPDDNLVSLLNIGICTITLITPVF